MSPADGAIVQRDVALPDLGLLLDPERLMAALAHTLRGRRLGVPSITYLRYKPGVNCLAACSVDVDGQAVPFSAKAFRRDGHKVQKLMSGAVVNGPLGAGRFVLADTSVIVSVFPNDGKLDNLAWLASPDAVTTIAERIGTTGAASAACIHTLKYNPERRFVGRLTTGDCDRAAVRCYRPEDYRRAADTADRVRSRGALVLARSLACDSAKRLVALEWLPGRLLDGVIVQTEPSRQDLNLVGAALAEFHRQDSPGLPVRTMASEAAALLQLAGTLTDLYPQIGAPARRLAMQLAEHLTAHRHGRHPIHGDFHARQVVLDSGTAGIIDLDEAASGDSAIDVGRFRSDLEAAIISGRLDARNVAAMIEFLFEGYEQISGTRPRRTDLHAAAQLFRLVIEPFRRREPAWPEQSVALLERARALLEKDDRATVARVTVPQKFEKTSNLAPARPHVTDSFGVGSDALMPFLKIALDPVQMSEQFAALRSFDSATDHRVHHITVTRFKPGRRCLIAYDVGMVRDGVTEESVLVGKVRARGPDAATHDLLRSLWDGAFCPGTVDGISVPEPIGVIASLHMTVQRKVPGSSLDCLLDGSDGCEWARRAAEAIDKLHRLGPPAFRMHSVQDEIRILQQRLATVAEEHPAWRDRLGVLLEGCRRMAGQVASDPVCGIHRDFYPNQLLADGTALYLLDLDLYSEGHPALDVGNFLAHIDEYSLRRFGDPNWLADRSRVLVDRYLELSSRTTRAAIEVYATLGLTRHVALSREFADRRPHTQALLELCEERVLGCRTWS